MLKSANYSFGSQYEGQKIFIPVFTPYFLQAESRFVEKLASELIVKLELPKVRLKSLKLFPLQTSQSRS